MNSFNAALRVVPDAALPRLLRLLLEGLPPPPPPEQQQQQQGGHRRWEQAGGDPSAAAAAALTPTLATAQALLERLPAHRQLRGELDAVLCRLLQAGLAPHYRVFLPWASHHGQAGSIRGVRGVMEQAALHGVEITPHYYTQLVRVSVDRCGVWEAVVWRGMQCDSLAAQRCDCCAATAVLPLCNAQAPSALDICVASCRHTAWGAAGGRLCA